MQATVATGLQSQAWSSCPAIQEDPQNPQVQLFRYSSQMSLYAILEVVQTSAAAYVVLLLMSAFVGRMGFKKRRKPVVTTSS